MKPPGTLRHIPSVLEEKLAVVTILIGVMGVVSALCGLGLLIWQFTTAGDHTSSARLRLEGLQRAIPGYPFWELLRFAAQAVLGGWAVVGGMGLRNGWPSARRIAGRYGGGTAALQAAGFVFEFGCVSPALGNPATDSVSIARVVLIAAAAGLFVHSLLLLIALWETEPGPLVWDTGARTPEGGIVVMPADVRRRAVTAAVEPSEAARWGQWLVVRLALPAAGLAFFGAVVWAGVSVWMRPEPLAPAYSAPTPNPTTTASKTVVASTPTPPRQASVPLPAGAIRAFDAHGAVRVIALGYTADGTMLVTVGRNGFVRLWGPNGGPVEADLAVPEPSPDGIVTATIAPDGRTLAVATSEGLPRLFDLPSLRARPPLADDPNRGRIRSVSFAADGRIAAGDDLGFRVWDADGQLHLTSANVPSGPFLAFAPDGRTLALGGEAVRLYDAATGRERLVLRWENGYLTGLAFSPDGAALAASSSTGIVTLWDAVTGHEKGKMRHPAAVNSVAFLPDGRRLVAGTETAVLQTWTVADRRSLGVRVVFSPARGPGAFWYGGARAIAFRTDGREFAVACGGAVAIFPLTALPAE